MCFLYFPIFSFFFNLSSFSLKSFRTFLFSTVFKIFLGSSFSFFLFLFFSFFMFSFFLSFKILFHLSFNAFIQLVLYLANFLPSLLFSFLPSFLPSFPNQTKRCLYLVLHIISLTKPINPNFLIKSLTDLSHARFVIKKVSEQTLEKSDYVNLKSDALLLRDSDKKLSERDISQIPTITVRRSLL